jgi:hypothetical protein
MININEIVTKVGPITKNLVSDQTYDQLTKKLNTAGVAFDVTHGLGQAAANSSAVLINSGGFLDQEVIAKVKYASPTTAGAEEIGALVNVLSFDSPDANYYYARVDGGTAKITKVVDGTFTTLTSSAFALAQDDIVTITFSRVGNLLTADFESGGTPATVNLSTTDSSLVAGGVMGFRSLSSAIWCSELSWRQV